jgi:hypothetical protein
MTKVQKEKIGEISYIEGEEKYNTEFYLTPKVKKFPKQENLSLAMAIPSTYHFYEQILFDNLDEDMDGYPDEKFGNNFVVICNGITKSKGWTPKKGLVTEGFKEKTKEEEEEEDKNLFYSIIPKLSSVKNPKKEFNINYFVIKK